MKLEASILLDHLATFANITYTANLGAEFSWVDVLHLAEGAQPETLHVCTPAMLEAHAPRAEAPVDESPLYLLVVTSGVQVGTALFGRVLDLAYEVGIVVAICMIDMSPKRVAQRLQSYMRDINEWLLEMDHRMLSGGMYQAILEASLPILRNRIIVTDCDYRLLSSVGSGKTGSPLIDGAIERSYFDEASVDRLVDEGFLSAGHVPQSRKFPKVEERRIDGLPVIDHAFFTSNTFCCYLMMVCDVRPPSRGQERLLSLLCDAVAHCVAKDWSRSARLSSRLGRFWYALLTGDCPTGDQLFALCTDRDVPMTSTFRVCTFDFDTDVAPRFVSESLQDAFGSHCYAFAKGHRVTVIAYGDWLKTRSFVESEPLRDLMVKHDMRVGISIAYENIADTSLAYRQALAALEIGPVGFVINPATARPLFFERCALDWVIQADGQEREDQIAFLARNNPVMRLEGENRGGIVGDRSMLACYLENNCDATATAKELGVHRNTVLNRMRAIAGRIDFDSGDVRQRLFLQLTIALIRRDGYTTAD